MFLYKILILQYKVFLFLELNTYPNQSKDEEYVLKKLGESFTLRDPKNKNKNDCEIEWSIKLDDDTIYEIYKNGKLNKSYSNYVKCSPGEDNCEALLIEDFSKNMIGEISKICSNQTYEDIYSFFLVGYEKPLIIKCESTNDTNCHLNNTSQLLHVREEQSINLECSFSYLSPHPVQFELHMSGCEDDEDKDDEINLDKSYFEYFISTTCKRSFSRTEKDFSCYISGKNNLNDAYDVGLEVSYGPYIEPFDANGLKKKIDKGKSVVLKCPISGYPIKYYWTVITNNDTAIMEYEKKNNFFTLPRTLPPGEYYYKCRAVSNKQSLEYTYQIKIS